MASSSSSSRAPARRLMKELAMWNDEMRSATKDQPGTTTGIERLGPISDDELYRWEAVINGRGVPGGYDDGRWLITITIPPTYPLSPPRLVFATPVVHPNVSLDTGEICLDLLKKEGWSGTYTVAECVKAVRLLLALPEVDSPLNVDVAALIREGDTIAASALVGFWSREERYWGD